MEPTAASAPIDRVAEGLAQIVFNVGRWQRAEERAAATLTITLTTTPFDVREYTLAALLLLADVPPESWRDPLGAPGADIVPAPPREAFLQLIDRERTYTSNVPVHTPLARVCRALVRRGVIDRLADARTPTALAEALGARRHVLDTPKKWGL